MRCLLHHYHLTCNQWKMSIWVLLKGASLVHIHLDHMRFVIPLFARWAMQMNACHNWMMNIKCRERIIMAHILNLKVHSCIKLRCSSLRINSWLHLASKIHCPSSSYTWFEIPTSMNIPPFQDCCDYLIMSSSKIIACVFHEMKQMSPWVSVAQCPGIDNSTVSMFMGSVQTFWEVKINERRVLGHQCAEGLCSILMTYRTCRNCQRLLDKPWSNEPSPLVWASRCEILENGSSFVTALSDWFL